MSRTWLEVKGNIVTAVDFGYGDDISVEQTLKKEKNGRITVIYSKIIGRAKDFANTETDKYIRSKTSKFLKKSM